MVDYTSGLPFDTDMRRVVAQLYWDTEGAVLVNNEEPFALKSGNRSPIYLDGRKLISNPPTMNLVTAFAYALASGLNFDVIAGGESAGIPYATALSQMMGKPLIYVKKRVKGHGTRSKIEGNLRPGQRVLLVEDLITDGGSKLDFIDDIRQSSGIVDHCLVVFDRLQGGFQALADINVNLISETDIDNLLTLGLERGYITDEVFNSVEAYLLDPRQWHAARLFDYSE